MVNRTLRSDRRTHNPLARFKSPPPIVASLSAQNPKNTTAAHRNAVTAITMRTRAHGSSVAGRMTA